MQLGSLGVISPQEFDRAQVQYEADMASDARTGGAHIYRFDTVQVGYANNPPNTYATRQYPVLTNYIAPPPAPAPAPTITVSPVLQTQISPQVSPVFQQQFQPSNSPLTGGTQQQAPTSQTTAPPVSATPAPIVSAPAPSPAPSTAASDEQYQKLIDLLVTRQVGQQAQQQPAQTVVAPPLTSAPLPVAPSSFETVSTPVIPSLPGATPEQLPTIPAPTAPTVSAPGNTGLIIAALGAGLVLMLAMRKKGK